MGKASVLPESRSLATAGVEQRYRRSVERAVNASCGASVADGCDKHKREHKKTFKAQRLGRAGAACHS